MKGVPPVFQPPENVGGGGNERAFSRPSLYLRGRALGTRLSICH